MTKISKIINEVERAIADLRRGEALLLNDNNRQYCIQSVEGLAHNSKLRGHLALTNNRAKAVFPEFSGIGVIKVVFKHVTRAGVNEISALSGICGEELPEDILDDFKLEQGGNPEKYAVELMKIAELIPAAIVIPFENDNSLESNDLLEVSRESIEEYRKVKAENLEVVCRAPLTLKYAEDVEIVVFRTYPSGKEHYAIIIGEPVKEIAPAVRIHSSCFTGDLLASLRCDCGDQLSEAIRYMGEEGSGVVLYLMQEGRGIGLANKLRAYKLQADGMDTVDANEFLGFDDDERPYLPAASMLKKLGIENVSLLTNNPRKVDGLTKNGITVAKRIPLVIPPHEHNDHYLGTKSARMGHLLGDKIND